MLTHKYTISDIQDTERVPARRWKTKGISLLQGDEGLAVMENSDFVGSQDGWKMDEVEWKGRAATTTSSNIFQYLESRGIPTHFVQKISDTEILVKESDMNPVECVFRFISTWSYHKRDKHENWEEALPEGAILDKPEIELFYKNDIILANDEIISDPLMECDEDGIPIVTDEWKFKFLHPRTWEPLDYVNIKKTLWSRIDGFLSASEIKAHQDRIQQAAAHMREQTLAVGRALQEFFSPADVIVTDGKTEHTKDGKIGDSVDGDSLRLQKPLVLETKLGKRFLWKWVEKDELITRMSEKYLKAQNEYDSFSKLSEKYSESGDTSPDSSLHQESTELYDIIKKEFHNNNRAYKAIIRKSMKEGTEICFSENAVLPKKIIDELILVTRESLYARYVSSLEELEEKYGNGEEVYERREEWEQDKKRELIVDPKKTAFLLDEMFIGIGAYESYDDFWRSWAELWRIVESCSLDKQGYRNHDDLWTVAATFDELAELTTELLRKHCVKQVSIEDLSGVTATHIVHALGRPEL